MKAIQESPLGINPIQQDATIIKVPIPKYDIARCRVNSQSLLTTPYATTATRMTQSYRDELSKVVKDHAENAKEAIRRVRREGMDGLKKGKAKAAKDDLFRLEKDVCLDHAARFGALVGSECCSDMICVLQLQHLTDKKIDAITAKMNTKLKELQNA
jgi:hypothetical protein